jgi:hypothetical protein
MARHLWVVDALGVRTGSCCDTTTSEEDCRVERERRQQIDEHEHNPNAITTICLLLMWVRSELNCASTFCVRSRAFFYVSEAIKYKYNRICIMYFKMHFYFVLTFPFFIFVLLVAGLVLSLITFLCLTNLFF